MQNELVRYAQGGEPVPIRDRKVARQARETFDEVRLKALQADGAMALGGHVMEGLLGLDDKRRDMARGDANIDLLMMEVESATIRQVKNIQNSLYGKWGV